MRKISIASLFVLLCFCFNLAACGVTDVFDDIVETTVSDSAQETPAASDIADVEVRYSDKSIAAPQFSQKFGYSIPLTLGTSHEIDGTCISADGGVITYQWYVNNINSNSGGSVIEGATESRYETHTKEPGLQYFYVVAYNNHGDRYNTATSDTVEIVTYSDGTWTPDEKGTKYVFEDGNYLADLWIWIEEDVYHFDAEGYRTQGWFQADRLYYFTQEGKLFRNGTTPDGCTTDGEGVLLTGTPDLPAPPPEEGEAAQAEGEAPPAEGEAAPAEGEAAPAEGEAPPAEEAVQETPPEEVPAEGESAPEG